MIKPWLWLPPQLAHSLSPLGVELYSLFHSERTPAWGSFSWQNIVFKNRLGLAGGVDKNADHLHAWQKLGCGFVEVGTITPEPQLPNPGQIFDRSLTDQALWNKMGFPSAGADEAFYNLKTFKDHSSLPILTNIGKNRNTPNELAHQDYIKLVQRLHSVSDAFVINISSPNTKGLRDLSKKETLQAFLNPLIETKNQLEMTKPFLLKLSPDLETDDLKRVLDTAIECQMDGFVLTNTTLGRNTQKTFSIEGGVSGKPLAEQSKLALRTSIEHLGQEKAKKLVISVGGVMTAADVFERISIGADLVEVYSTLIFSGLNFFRKVAKVADEPKQESQKF